jgi:hypothetical protein
LIGDELNGFVPNEKDACSFDVKRERKKKKNDNNNNNNNNNHNNNNLEPINKSPLPFGYLTLVNVFISLVYYTLTTASFETPANVATTDDDVSSETSAEALEDEVLFSTQISLPLSLPLPCPVLPSSALVELILL